MSSTFPVESLRRLPEDLLADFTWQTDIDEDCIVIFLVPNSYDELLEEHPAASEVIGIQRFITLTRSVKKIEVRWESEIAARVSKEPHLFPLLAVTLISSSVSHFVRSINGWKSRNIRDVGQRIREHRLSGTGSARASDLSVSVEGTIATLAPDLYDAETLTLLPRDAFITLAVDFFESRLSEKGRARDVYNRATLLGTILAELIENSEMHGRAHQDGRPIQGTAVRGVMFRTVFSTFRVKNEAGGPSINKTVECFEASVFDSGIGYFHSYAGEAISDKTSLKDEWKVVHKCLERHYFPELADSRPAHRGMGLFEVLRALQALKGRIEFRTGSVYAHRTFFDEEVQAGMEPKQPLSHLRWPKPRLLDVEKKYLALPSKQELLVGSSVRIVVPLN